MNMNVKRLTPLLALVGGVIGVLCAVPAEGQYPFGIGKGADMTHATTVTFSKPIALPGVTLPAGTYLFEHPAGAIERHIVRVWSNDQKTIYTTLHTVPNARFTPTNQTVITFMETPAGSVDTVMAWFYPGERVGDEFIYSRAEALAIAKATRQSVLSESEPVRVNEKGQSEAATAPKK
jgi:hypothetical protein